MRYRVRTPEGELEYESILHVEQAYVAGLVEPEDEVLEEGGTLWRKASSLPNLARARGKSSASKPSRSTQTWSILIAAVLGVFALVLLSRGAGLWALLVVLGASSLVWRVTYQAFRRKR